MFLDRYCRPLCDALSQFWKASVHFLWLVYRGDVAITLCIPQTMVWLNPHGIRPRKGGQVSIVGLEPRNYEAMACFSAPSEFWKIFRVIGELQVKEAWRQEENIFWFGAKSRDVCRVAAGDRFGVGICRRLTTAALTSIPHCSLNNQQRRYQSTSLPLYHHPTTKW